MALQATARLVFLLFTSWHLRLALSLLIPNNAYRYRQMHRAPLQHQGTCNNNDNDGYGRPRYRSPWGTRIRSCGVSLWSQSYGDSNSVDDGEVQRTYQHDDKQDRRSFLEQSALSITAATLGTTCGSTSANARGLVRFPCTEPLLNTYHVMRAGSSLLEVEDIWSTNPLFLTNREAALSEIGEGQVREACKYLKSTGSTPTVVRYSLAAACIDSANIVGEELRIGRDRLVPEFNYMDPRAIGGWDFAALNATEEAVWAMDADEAGAYGKGGKPPPNEDGTPAETLADQVVRLTNLMSVLETLYSGDTVLLVFPDGSGPALLSCLIGGIPLNRVHELQYCPGEIRCDVDYKSINALAAQPPSQAYLNILERGRGELKQLRENPDMLRNIKDLKYEEELERENQEREARQKQEAKGREIEQQRREEERLKKEQESRERDAKRKELAEVQELEKRRKREERLQLQSSDSTSSQNSLDVGSLGIAGAVVVGGVVAIAGLSGAGETANVNEGSNDVLVTRSEKDLLLNSTDTATISDSEECNEISTEEQPVSGGNIDIEKESVKAKATLTDESLSGSSDLISNGAPIEDNLNVATVPDDMLPEENLNSDTDATTNSNEIQQNDIDYDDWGEAWLGTISEILEDANNEGD